MATWGIVPAAGRGSRIQPLACSKELLPVGSRPGEREQPRAVSEYLIDRLVLGGAGRICFVIAPGKSDILEYYASSGHPAAFCYVVQPEPEGLCDAIFRAVPLIGVEDEVLVGLPDTIWFPEDGFRSLPGGCLSFLLFPVDQAERFDAVVSDERGCVIEVQVKAEARATNWIWGAFRMPGAVLHELYDLWQARGRADEYFGTLVNAFLARGGKAQAVRAGRSYVDVGTISGYHRAVTLLQRAV